MQTIGLIQTVLLKQGYHVEFKVFNGLQFFKISRNRSLENVPGNNLQKCRGAYFSEKNAFFGIFPLNKVRKKFNFSDHGVSMDPHKDEGGFQRDEKSAVAHSDHLEDIVGEHRDVPLSLVTVKNFKKRVERESPANDLKGTLCGAEFSINCGDELETQQINIPGVHMVTGVQESISKQGEKSPCEEVEVGDVHCLNSPE